MSPTANDVVTEGDVTTAEREAGEAEALVEALRRRVADGDPDVQPQEITQARELAEFAALRAEATARRLAGYRERVRLASAEQLRDEIRSDQNISGTHLADLAEAAKAALHKLSAALTARDAQMLKWRTEMKQLGVPEHGNPLVPPAQHGNLGHTSEQIIAGDKRLTTLPTAHLLSQVIGEFAGEAGQPIRPMPSNANTVTAHLRTADAPAHVPDGARHFLTVGGSILTLDREPTDSERRGIEREITQKEAWGQ